MIQWQGSLFASGPPSVTTGTVTERLHLDHTSWIDVTRGWLTGADEVARHLADTVAWRQGRRTMFDREVDDPRLSRWGRSGEPPAHPVLAEAADALTARYDRPFGAPGLNYYRDGHDSVAFHRDRELRLLNDTLVAVLTLGARRPFLVRRHGGGRALDLAPASGDLLVMGGRHQRDWEHGVPKLAHCAARISVSWRWTSGHGAVSLAYGTDAWPATAPTAGAGPDRGARGRP